ncbi:MAG: 23S rRNA (pseudouridine(1915)-N(3))-methyltransferase RlmH [Muribaculaceae bacterium]|nr:23S rRNA (pseudouridine(1915)-N(3))-methyltransferase RlmH [Muribaculaceae bacterium]
MKITLLTIGKTTQKNIDELIRMYAARVSHYVDFSVESIPDLRSTRGLTELQQKMREGEMILAALKPSDRVVLLDEKGREFTSREFSQEIQKRMSAADKRLVFVVGGPYGFSDSVYGRADALMSLSRMTFPHELVRVFFVEQIYRAMTILRGEPYHHD